MAQSPPNNVITFKRNLETGTVQVSGDQTSKLTQRRRKSKSSSSSSNDGEAETLSAYQAFFQANFEAYKADQVAAGRKINVNAIVALIGKRWRELDAAGRDAWAGSSVLMKKKQPRAGPKSLTAYQLFFRENAAQLSGKADGYERAPGITQMDIVSTVGARWRAITPAMLADFTQRAAAITAQLRAEAEGQVAAGALAQQEAAGWPAGAAPGASSSSSYSSYSPSSSFLPSYAAAPAKRAKVDGAMGALRAAAAEAAEAWPPPATHPSAASNFRGLTPLASASLTPI